MSITDRITPLIKKLEAGEKITVDDIHTTHQLQCLDMMLVQQQFADESIAREQAAVQHMQDIHDASVKELGS